MQKRSVPSHISLISSGFPDSFSSWWMKWAKAFIRFALPPTHTNYGKQRKRTSELGCLAFEIVNPLFFFHFTNLNISKHFWKVVSLCAQAEVVENILLHGVQVGILHLDMLSKSNTVQHISKWTDYRLNESGAYARNTLPTTITLDFEQETFNSKSSPNTYLIYSLWSLPMQLSKICVMTAGDT